MGLADEQADRPQCQRLPPPALSIFPPFECDGQCVASLICNRPSLGHGLACIRHEIMLPALVLRGEAAPGSEDTACSWTAFCSRCTLSHCTRLSSGSYEHSCGRFSTHGRPRPLRFVRLHSYDSSVSSSPPRPARRGHYRPRRSFALWASCTVDADAPHDVNSRMHGPP